jgi:hypothetical protein
MQGHPEERAIGEYLCSGDRFVDEHDFVGDLSRDAYEDPGLASDGVVSGCRPRRIGR